VNSDSAKESSADLKFISAKVPTVKSSIQSRELKSTGMLLSDHSFKLNQSYDTTALSK